MTKLNRIIIEIINILPPLSFHPLDKLKIVQTQNDKKGIKRIQPIITWYFTFKGLNLGFKQDY